MIELNIVGLFLIIFMILLEIFNVIFSPKRVFKHKLHKQISLIRYIAYAGLIFFSPITLFNYGYHYYNNVVLIIWIILVSIAYLLLIALYIRYLANKRKEEYLYNKCVIIAPISFLKSFIFLLSAFLLLNYYCMFFSIVYAITEIYINIKLNFE